MYFFQENNLSIHIQEKLRKLRKYLILVSYGTRGKLTKRKTLIRRDWEYP